MKNSRITIANTPAQIRRCHPVMRELRMQFTNPEKFIERVLRQQKQGYLLAFLEYDGEVCAVAGYRFLESLFSGKFLYVDDLVTREDNGLKSAPTSTTTLWCPSAKDDLEKKKDAVIEARTISPIQDISNILDI